MRLLRTYRAFLLLALFLFPFIQIGMHDIEHGNDFHCNERSSQHFHALEHHCSVCDEVYSIGNQPEAIGEYKILLPGAVVLSSFSLISFEKTAIRFFSLRAPPKA